MILYGGRGTGGCGQYFLFTVWNTAAKQYIFSLHLTHGTQGLKGLNLVRCGTRNIFGFNDQILPQEGRPIFVSIARYKACIFRSMMLWQQLNTSVLSQ